MKKIVLVALGALIMVPSAAFAADDAAPQEAPKKDPADRWVCKTDKMTGSLTRSRRLCMKRSEWDKLAAGTAQDVDKLVAETQRRDKYVVNTQAGPGWN